MACEGDLKVMASRQEQRKVTGQSSEADWKQLVIVRQKGLKDRDSLDERIGLLRRYFVLVNDNAAIPSSNGSSSPMLDFPSRQF